MYKAVCSGLRFIITNCRGPRTILWSYITIHKGGKRKINSHYISPFMDSVHSPVISWACLHDAGPLILGQLHPGLFDWMLIMGGFLSYLGPNPIEPLCCWNTHFSSAVQSALPHLQNMTHHSAQLLLQTVSGGSQATVASLEALMSLRQQLGQDMNREEEELGWGEGRRGQIWRQWSRLTGLASEAAGPNVGYFYGTPPLLWPRSSYSHGENCAHGAPCEVCT